MTFNVEFVTNSKVMADKFDKSHRHIINDIMSMIEDSQEFCSANVKESSYVSLQNKVLPCYDMTRDAAIMLVMRMTGTKAAQWKENFIKLNSKVAEFNMDLITATEDVCGEMGYCYIVKSSNGLVKVGQSGKHPLKNRIPTHSGVLETFGDKLVDTIILKPAKGVDRKSLERKLINYANEIAEERRSNEWFYGLDINKLASKFDCEIVE